MMYFKSIDKAEAASALEMWRSNPDTFQVEEPYSDLRDTLVTAYSGIKKTLSRISDQGDSVQDQYILDLEYGLKLYTILGGSAGFTLRMASDDGVWRFLAVCIIPDIVADRWGKDNDDHYWAKPSRNWLRQIWWYVYLSWNNTVDATRDVLKDNSTDEILNLVERAGRGYNVELGRRIMFYYSKVPQNVRTELKKGKGRTLFRTIMVMNTAFSQTIEPALYKDKEDGYVRWLFTNAGVPDI